MASKAHTKEYSSWVDRAFQSDVQRHGELLNEAVDARRLDLLACALRDLSDCYHRRGAVQIVSSNETGWYDVQNGYLAMSYCFQISKNLQTGWINRIKDGADFTVEIVAHLGMSRLFSRSFDTEQILAWLDSRFDLDQLLGKSNAGRQLLESIFDGEPSAEAETLKNDRIECCRRRSAHPNRLTEYEPYGILDIEMALCYPSFAEFPYPDIQYTPTEDEFVLRGIETCHRWLG